MVILYVILASYCFLIGLIIDFYKKTLNQSNILLIIIFILIMFNVGFRGIIEFSDTEAYYYRFIHMNNIENIQEYIFDFLMLFVKALDGSYQYFLVLVSILYYSLSYLTLKKYSETYFVDTYFSGFIFLSMFFTYALSSNIIRQGLAISLTLYSLLILFNNRRYLKGFLFLFLAFFTHNSIFSIFLLYFIVLIFSKIKLIFYFIFYIISIVLSFLKLNLFTNFTFIKTYEDYFTGDLDYLVGFKPGVVAFNTFFLLLGLFLIRSKNYKILDRNYINIYKLYILLSSVFFMLSEVPFSDRFGVLGWSLIPYLIIPYFSYKVNISKVFLVSFFIMFYFLLNFYFSI